MVAGRPSNTQLDIMCIIGDMGMPVGKGLWGSEGRALLDALGLKSSESAVPGLAGVPSGVPWSRVLVLCGLVGLVRMCGPGFCPQAGCGLWWSGSV